jgi:thermitase
VAAFAAVLVVTLGALAARQTTPRASLRAGGGALTMTAIRAASRAGLAGTAESAQGPYVLGEVLVGFRNGVSGSRQLAIEHAIGAQSATRLGPPIKPVGHGPATGQAYLAPMDVRVGRAQVFPSIQRLKRYAEVAYAEPNYLQVGTAKPNDPFFGKQWGSENTGQLIPFQDQNETPLGAEKPGTKGADDKATAAWGVTTGSRSIVIGEVDSGVAYEHPDLKENIWSNPGGVNGCEAGTHGANVLATKGTAAYCNPIDEDTAYNGHGTHVAGIMGAVGNNTTGVAGINWQTTILPVRWMNSASSGATSDLVAALNWLVAAKQAGVNVRVANDSDTFPGTAISEPLSHAIDVLGENGILFVTAAGNTAQNNDTVPRYPCSYERPTEICVTASNNEDKLPGWANFGAKSVQLAAPGVSIYSTLRGGTYGWLSGGSMASPQVAGTAALVLSVSPKLTTTELRADILNSVDKLSAFAGSVQTGGRLNVCRAVPGCIEKPTEEEPKPEALGSTEPGANSDKFETERKRVNRYALPTNGWVTKLNVYLAPTSTSGQQVMKGVIYSDTSGKPEKLLAVTEPLTFKSTNSAGWYELPLKPGLQLSAGNYWIGVITGPTNSVAGFRWTSVTGARISNANTYSSGPTNPFGTAEKTDAEQMSLYASYWAVPFDTVVPTIAGTAQQEKQLTEAHGTWANEPTSFKYKWQQCDGSGNNCAGIGAATNPTYTPVAADVGHTIRVQETAINAKGQSAPATSAATAVVLPAPPKNIGAPTISGEARQGQTLTEAHGAWENNPTSYTYQWQQCDGSGNNCANIAGASEQNYKALEADVGHTLKVIEKATNAGGSGEATSTQTAVVLPLAPSGGVPTISGEARQGQTLTEAHGKWANNPTSYSYVWQQCNNLGEGCLPITGATEQTYKPVAGDVGHALRVVEKATNAGGSGEAPSAATTPVAAPVPVNEVPPEIIDPAQQGQTLTEAHGKWTNSPTSYSYEWQQCDSKGTPASCTKITGAAEQTYTPGPGDVGHAIRVLETATNAAGPSAPAPSAPTEAVKPPPPTGGVPTITGTAQQGQTLTEHHGSWTNNPTAFSYQWQQCDGSGNNCTNILTNATNPTYVPVEGDVGHTLRVIEKATNAGGSGEAASAMTAVVLPEKPAPTTPPTIEGKAQVGQTLTENHGTWTNNPTSFTYQWLQCDSQGNSCALIAAPAGTAKTYTPVEGDLGHRLKVQEEAHNAGGNGGPATSAATAEVGPATGIVGLNKIGVGKDVFAGGRKRVNRYALPTNGSFTKLTIYLTPTTKVGQQVMEGVIYADEAGSPAQLLGTTEQFTFHSTFAAGWYDMKFPTPVKVPAGNYWFGELTGATANVAGFRYETVPGSRDFNANVFSSGPSNPFGAFTTDAEQTSLYATYTPG